MKVHILGALLPPSEVSEGPLLLDLTGEPLDGGASMLLLAWVNDGLRAESA